MAEAEVLRSCLQLPVKDSVVVPTLYLRDYGVSRIRFRELVYKGQIPGVRKASW